ncbi:MerR family transcriptional regulator [Cohaesibacter celericrescens]|uniref:MerR family transcriptional regulator n=1 Tax=Cohaesibacter celericrescens TaxID=2067669 RepID=A0A2N5XKL3_9HYPH|nr:MerR family transcriptional regulator [Cohaesibacter celericrescens]PLW75056.1 MerR family transcriptional regulator [Cohaesibacter celericrescens]
MRIKEASKSSGLSTDTIRYYEKEGLLPPINRDRSGHRAFSLDNVQWMTVLYWLRKTGMPMRVMSRYAHLVHSGDHTIPQRVAILTEHRALLAARRAELDRCEEILTYKLSAYEDAEKGPHHGDNTNQDLER